MYLFSLGCNQCKFIINSTWWISYFPPNLSGFVLVNGEALGSEIHFLSPEQTETIQASHCVCFSPPFGC